MVHGGACSHQKGKERGSPSTDICHPVPEGVTSRLSDFSSSKRFSISSWEAPSSRSRLSCSCLMRSMRASTSRTASKPCGETQETHLVPPSWYSGKLHLEFPHPRPSWVIRKNESISEPAITPGSSESMTSHSDISKAICRRDKCLPSLVIDKVSRFCLF